MEQISEDWHEALEKKSILEFNWSEGKIACSKVWVQAGKVIITLESVHCKGEVNLNREVIDEYVLYSIYDEIDGCMNARPLTFASIQCG